MAGETGIASDLLAAPKCELHVRLEGAISAKFLFGYLKKYQEAIPEKVRTTWSANDFPVRSRLLACETVDQFKEASKSVADSLNVNLLILQGHLDVIEESARVFVKTQASNNVIYSEVRYNPHTFLKPGSKSMRVSDVVRAVTRGLQRGVKENPGTHVKQILCMLSDRPDWSEQITNLAISHRDQGKDLGSVGVVGVDIAGSEDYLDREEWFHEHAKAIKRAQEKGLHVTLRAGKGIEDYAHVERAITAYNPERIVHGYGAFQKKDVLAMLRAKNIHLELCPTSFLRQHNNGAVFGSILTRAVFGQNSCSLNTEKPEEYNSDICDNYNTAIKLLGLESKNQVREHFTHMMEQAVKHAFCSETEKSMLLTSLRKHEFYAQGTAVLMESRLVQMLKLILQSSDSVSEGILTNWLAEKFGRSTALDAIWRLRAGNLARMSEVTLNEFGWRFFKVARNASWAIPVRNRSKEENYEYSAHLGMENRNVHDLPTASDGIMGNNSVLGDRVIIRTEEAPRFCGTGCLVQ